jgi:predicted nucleic acid-binding protein
MITALDTNVPSALWSGKPFAAAVAAALARAAQDGGLLICGPVYAELLAYPGATAEFVDQFLDVTRITIEFDLHPDIWREAGKRFAGYCQRRRHSGGGEPKRLLVDFLVGAHAFTAAGRLFTLDPVRYRKDFPELQVVDTV